MPEIAPSTITAEHETHEKYEVNDAIRLIINSFRFSQGDELLQRDFLKQVGYLVHGKLDPETVRQAIEPTTTAVEKIVSNSKLHSKANPALAREEVESNANFLAENINDQQPSNNLSATSVIWRDYKFLIDREGRDRADTERRSPATDPYLSQFVYYGLMAQTTGSPEYDQIFAEAVKAYEEHVKPEHPDYKDMVNLLIEKYLSNHPDQIDLLPETERPLAQAA
jgi:hypothetical protein